MLKKDRRIRKSVDGNFVYGDENTPQHIIDMYVYYRNGHNLRETGEHFDKSKQAVSQAFRRSHLETGRRKSTQLPIHGAAILKFIYDYKTKFQDTPSYKAIAAAVTGDERNNGNVYRMVERLIELGYLYRAGASGDVLMLTQPQPKLPEEMNELREN